ncbi:MAG: CopG family transcriptional regulator [Candidatus Diapherotrites archaeon]|nr:CopG family transcriptional regulator [Candidatus Diapherotrites archaeon]
MAAKKGSAQKITTVSIPAELAEKIRKKCKNTGFHSVSSYVTYVLRIILSEPSELEKDKRQVFSKEDEARVKANLKGLGYL